MDEWRIRWFLSSMSSPGSTGFSSPGGILWVFLVKLEFWEIVLGVYLKGTGVITV